jgi:hypothetical protein
MIKSISLPQLHALPPHSLTKATASAVIPVLSDSPHHDSSHMMVVSRASASRTLPYALVPFPPLLCSCDAYISVLRAADIPQITSLTVLGTPTKGLHFWRIADTHNTLLFHCYFACRQLFLDYSLIYTVFFEMPYRHHIIFIIVRMPLSSEAQLPTLFSGAPLFIECLYYFFGH